MKAVQFPAKGVVTVASLDTRRPGLDEVLIRVRASGICHTDIGILRGNYDISALPLVPGHEYCGEVVEVGPNVTGISTSDRVVVDPNIECGRCPACARGMTNLCENLQAYGVTENGGFAEFSTVRNFAVVRLRDLPFAHGALAEPVGCVLNGISAIGIEGVQNALIFGAGPFGILMGMTLRAKGVANVTLADIAVDRLDLSASLGFGTVRSAAPALVPLRHELDLVVDATGIPAIAESLPTYRRNGDRGLFFGVCPGEASISISPFEMSRRQLTLAGSHSLNHNIAEALAVIR